VGLGAGILPRAYQARGIATDVVEIDPEVVELARRYFGFAPRGQVFLEDARAHLEASDRRYDFVLLDVFSGDITPGHLLSREALTTTKRHLNERGVLGINLVGALGLTTASIVRSLERLFEQVEVYPTFDPESQPSGNLAIVAYDGPPRPFSPARLTSAVPIHPLARVNVGRNLGRRYRIPDDAPSIELTDDFNPLDLYDARLRESVRRNILACTDWDLLLASE